MPRDDQHLGDGAYVSHDGSQLWLAANHHENRTVALERHALLSLVRYAIHHGYITKNDI